MPVPPVVNACVRTWSGLLDVPTLGTFPTAIIIGGIAVRPIRRTYWRQGPNQTALGRPTPLICRVTWPSGPPVPTTLIAKWFDHFWEGASPIQSKTNSAVTFVAMAHRSWSVKPPAFAAAKTNKLKHGGPLLKVILHNLNLFDVTEADTIALTGHGLESTCRRLWWPASTS